MSPMREITNPIISVLALACLSGVASQTAMAKPSVVEVRVRGASLFADLSDGRTLTGPQLTGAILTIADRNGRRIQVRIDGAERDPQDEHGQRWLYDLKSRDPNKGTWRNFCGRGPKGLQLGFAVGGTLNADGTYTPSDTQVSFSCTGGAIAKCIRMGYEPQVKTDAGVPLVDHFRACVRMIRADYCGDGRPHTRNGTLINIYDRLGIQKSETSPGLSLEAAWGPDGAVCVRKTRIGEIWSLDDLNRSCGRRLAGRIGSGCTSAIAESLPGALIFNESLDAP